MSRCIGEFFQRFGSVNTSRGTVKTGNQKTVSIFTERRIVRGVSYDIVLLSVGIAMIPSYYAGVAMILLLSMGCYDTVLLSMGCYGTVLLSRSCYDIVLFSMGCYGTVFSEGVALILCYSAWVDLNFVGETAVALLSNVW